MVSFSFNFFPIAFKCQIIHRFRSGELTSAELEEEIVPGNLVGLQENCGRIWKDNFSLGRLRWDGILCAHIVEIARN